MKSNSTPRRVGIVPKLFLLMALLGLPQFAGAHDFGGQANAQGATGDSGPDCSGPNPPASCCDACPCTAAPGDGMCSAPSDATAGDPIAVIRGRQVLNLVDLQIPGVYPIVMTRSY